MQRWLFYVCLQGAGSDMDAAWQDACEQFGLDPGESPDNVLDADAAIKLESKLAKIEFSTPLACRHPDDDEET